MSQLRDEAGVVFMGVYADSRCDDQHVDMEELRISQVISEGFDCHAPDQEEFL